MSFALYAVGYLFIICGVIYGAHLMHVPQHWIVVIAVILAGLGITSAVATTRNKDSS